ncbi:hypothetical protein ABS767_12855 [Sphingomonas sp. ST-64]|uniref:OAA-family lectin sugar binding domain-containing protein n=1 Tax=Sphingomonas plantiphila TaxID=3163295 RepID=A0ABW8YPM0_9SPHN
MTNPDQDIDRWTVRGRWAAPVPFTRPLPPTPRSPLIGIFDTEIGYGGRIVPENHQIWVFADGCRVMGVPVQRPDWKGRTLSFTQQSDATRAGKPWAGSITFGESDFAGWCQFPGEGPVDWRGRLLYPEPPVGEWPMEVLEGDRWMLQPHPLRIAPGTIAIGEASIAEPFFRAGGFSFDRQPGATSGGVPSSGTLQQAGTGWEGTCSFPGEPSRSWRSRAPSPPYGLYRTSIGIGGRWYDEHHPVEISGSGVRIAGVPVTGATLDLTSLAFTNQADATRAGKPWAGRLRFDGTNCSGWCQFPGEGPVDWRGVLVEAR